MEDINWKWVSAEQYSKATGLGVEEVKRQCNLGKLECFRTEGGYYKIKVMKNDGVPREEFNKVVEENIRLKTLIDSVRVVIG